MATQVVASTTSSCSPAKKRKIDDVLESLQESVEAVDVLLRATCYSLMTQQYEEATSTLEKVRRRLKCLNLKAKDNMKLVSQEQLVLLQKISVMTTRESFLVKENTTLKKKLKELQTQLGYMCGDEEAEEFGEGTSACTPKPRAKNDSQEDTSTQPDLFLSPKSP